MELPVPWISSGLLRELDRFQCGPGILGDPHRSGMGDEASGSGLIRRILYESVGLARDESFPGGALLLASHRGARVIHSNPGFDR